MSGRRTAMVTIGTLFFLMSVVFAQPERDAGREKFEKVP